MKAFDVLIVGSGIAGLSAALKASTFAKVALCTKAKLKDSNTSYAQGGLAGVSSRSTGLARSTWI
jgi:L-aspartate oxidase